VLQDSHLITTNTARGGTCAKGAETKLKSHPTQRGKEEMLVWGEETCCRGTSLAGLCRG